MTHHLSPGNPATVPASAALELIVRVPREVAPDADHELTELLQDFAGILDVEGLFAGLAWHDASHVAVAVLLDTLYRDKPAEFLAWRAARVLEGSDDMAWVDAVAAARALNIAARVLGL